ncbi:MAG: hypothetical protein ABEJ77_00920 [Halanaeroarchaeum sp.]
MDTVVELLELPHPDEAPALESGRRSYEYARFRATAYKTANYLRYNGVGDHATVAIVPERTPETAFGVLGAALLGGTVEMDPPDEVDATVLIGPTDDLDAYETTPGCKRIGYGNPPEDPSWAYFEREVWSENPFFPQVDVDGATPLLDGVTQGSALTRAREIGADLRPADDVAVRESLANPDAIVAGLLAPLVVGATVLFPSEGQTGSVAVGADGPEERTVPATPTGVED